MLFVAFECVELLHAAAATMSAIAAMHVLVIERKGYAAPSGSRAIRHISSPNRAELVEHELGELLESAQRLGSARPHEHERLIGCAMRLRRHHARCL